MKGPISDTIGGGIVAGVAAWQRALAVVCIVVGSVVILACGAIGVSRIVRSGSERGPEPIAAGNAPGNAPADTAQRVVIDGIDVTSPEGSAVIVRREKAGENAETRTSASSEGDDPSANVTGGKAATAAGKRDYAGLAGVIDAAAALSGESRYLSLVLIGGILAAAGLVVMLWLQQRALGLGLIAGGVAMATLGVVADTAPWVFAVLVAVAAVGAALVIAHARLARGNAAALTAIVPAVEASDPNSTSGLKAAIERHAGGAVNTVRSAVRRVKTKVIGATPSASSPPEAAPHGSGESGHGGPAAGG